MNRFGPINPNDPAIRAATRGGIPIQQQKKVPVIPWDAFVACGLQVYRDDKIQLAVFDPQVVSVTGYGVSADEVFQTLRLLLAAQGKKPGPIAWDTVPEEIKRHFKFQDDKPAVETG